ncbi:NAD(P)/FAD-dependent oxidoreductase [Corynebacterium freiburgense]|uniref:NAD(P)/FAD-dependent oxidoreductase n=1 Tax=Corynebacterium freiburgense TaxID=556548 RepID=UPI000479158C|nr:FAD-dependent oxidoreductase [Corynebacterium freiburgense]WJZ03615.1 Benzene 1,2-dioxygenase system ferredoxin--NAD(+) reductase subunit [Corynebacterium freiburgense]
MSSTTIIGGGIAGFTLASELRSRGYAGEITIIDPNGLPYDRPPLSKEILSGEKNAEQLLLAPRSWYEEQGVNVVRGQVGRIAPENRELVMEDGSTRGYDNLVLATGGIPRNIPAFEHLSVFVLRTVEDAENLKKVLTKGVHLAIVGAGLIGAEVASSARELGAEVTLIDPAPIALVPALGEELARRLHALHKANGVHTITGLTTSIEHTEHGYAITIDGHDAVQADYVLLAVGIVPEERLARSAGLDCDGGVLVDYAQRTSLENIWAIGDCARTRNEDGTLLRRHEHWESAVFEAQTAAASITGQELPQHGAAWFWTDRYGVHVEGVGSMTEEGETVLRPNKHGEPEVAFRVRPDGTLAGCAAIDNGMAVRAARRIIDRRIVVAPEQLRDPNVNLKKLAR